MKNVIIFAVGGQRCAVELRWVTEVVSLGFVTPVPGAPAVIAGVTSMHGTITPVLCLEAVLDGAEPATETRTVQAGDSAILLQIEAVTAAILISKVDEVTTLRDVQSGGELRDTAGTAIRVLDPPSLIGQALASIHDRANRMGALHGAG